MWNDALTFLGIDNANTDKKERLITAEAESNDEHTDLSAEVMLKTRRIAAEQINKMYGLNVSVKIKEQKKPETKEGEKDGEIHD
jgi:hypothetical protein